MRMFGKRIARLEREACRVEQPSYVLEARDGETADEAWRRHYGDLPVPPDYVCFLLPGKCATTDEWLAKYAQGGGPQ